MSHKFILEVLEAIYIAILQCYLQVEQSQDYTSGLIEAITSSYTHYLQTIYQVLSVDSCSSFNKNMSFLIQNSHLFLRARYVQMIRGDFGSSFIFRMPLYLTLRNGDWKLCIKNSIAPIFTALDHLVYQKLISQHLADMLTMPAPVLTISQQGEFVASILGYPWHSVAIDESYEMLISKKLLKTAKHQLSDQFQIIAIGLPNTSLCLMKNLKKWL